MSTIAELIIEQGRIAAAARSAKGQLWGRAIENISAIPRDVMQQQRAREAFEMEKREQTSRLQLQGQQSALAGQQIQVGQQAQQETGVLNQLFSDPEIYGPDGTINRAGLQKRLSTSGMAALWPKVVTIADTLDESSNKILEQKAKLADTHRETLGKVALQLQAAGYDPGASHLVFTGLAKDGTLSAAQAQQYLQLQQPEQIKAVVNGWLPGTAAAKEAQAAKTSGFREIPKEGTLIDVNVIEPATGKPRVLATGAPATSTFESKQVLLDNKPAVVNFDPKTGKHTLPTGEDVSSRVKPLPPASIQVQNQIAAQSASTVPVDAARPDPVTGNKIDSQTGMTPNALYQAALDHALKGTMPQLGFGQSPRAMAIRTGIVNKASAIAAAAGVDLPNVRAQYKANAATLNKLLPQAMATANAANTASDNLDLALQASPKVTRTDSAWINKVANNFVRGATAAAPLTDFEVKIYTAAREYAKVTSGGALSAQGLTDSAAREAEKLLSSSQSPEALQAAVDAMKADMANVVSEQAKGLAKISETIGTFFSVANGGGPVQPNTPTAPTPATTGTTSTKIGRFDVVVH